MSPRWTPLAASVIGSVHVRDGLPLQDAAAVWSEGDAAVMALADGHGHHDHPLSDVGATLAAEVAVGELRRALPQLADPASAAAAGRRTAEGIVAAWRTAVDQHRGDGAPRQDPYLAYGTTLIAVAVSGETLVVLQIGDGDVVLADAAGVATRPLPVVAGHDGVHTSSLCQTDPLAALRLAVVDLRTVDVALVYACTDGFGTARVDADWREQTARQLQENVVAHGTAWIAERLPGWLEEPALIGGDDTTLAVLVSR